MVPLAPESIPVSDSQFMIVEMNGGSLDISQGDVGQVRVSGSGPAAGPAIYTLKQQGDGIYLISRDAGSALFQPVKAPIHLDLQTPGGFSIKVTADNSDVNVQNYSGRIDISSMTGNILAQNVSGVFNLNSNRGNVTVNKGKGEIHLTGNYGFLTLSDTHGKMNASTIMGTARFAGKIGAGDLVHLETDHGPVEIQLTPDSDTGIKIRTISGVVSCLIPGLIYSSAPCDGRLHGGAGQLEIRTVSGSVMLRQMP
jgi:hypothetical protein